VVLYSDDGRLPQWYNFPNLLPCLAYYALCHECVSKREKKVFT
jgi:hypothetical protein